MLYNINDAYIGRSLAEYGEFSEGEIDLFEQLIKKGQTILEVGANIGSHTVWLSQAVGSTGTVLAFEPQRIVYQTLCANLALNSITNVHCFCAAAGKAPGQIMVPELDYSRESNFGGLGLGAYQEGESVPVLTIDGLNLPKCHFIKIDVEGMEQEVLEGAVRTIAALSPILYVENDRKEKSDSLIRFIDGLGYKMYDHAPPLFSPRNFAGSSVNVFGQIVSLNMLCLPKASPPLVPGLRPVRVRAAKMQAGS
jgi:FkbM family methyltransferase